LLTLILYLLICSCVHSLLPTVHTFVFCYSI
jgi:hypothetical protein